jgi:pterin-4a-carbinolamine dehydratase
MDFWDVYKAQKRLKKRVNFSNWENTLAIFLEEKKKHQ